MLRFSANSSGDISPPALAYYISNGYLIASADVSSIGYGVTLLRGNTPNGCSGENPCGSVGYLRAEKGKTIISERLEQVSLTGGITGYYKPLTCGGSCSPQTMQWIYKGVHYIVQLDGEKVDLVNLANSAIENASDM